jgi:DNA polymerase III alpha subunit (gram-positive type)
MKALFFDTETGGLNPRENSVFSVGALVGDLDTGQIIDQFESYVRLGSVDDYNYNARSIEIHGITPEQAMEEGRAPEEIAQQFTELYYDNDASIFGGHNVSPFDRDFMSFNIFNCTPQEFESNFCYRYVDTLPLVRLALTGTIASGASLGQATKAFNIDMSDMKGRFHAALFDSVCSFRVAHKFRSVITKPDVLEKLRV